jgi:anti-anti-sigma regulatory factor
MFKIWRSSSRRWVLYFVSGRIDVEAVSELKRLLRRESSLNKVVLDLREVRLVDAEAVEYFEHCEDAGIRLRNCPAYVRKWIASNRRKG